MAGKKGAVRMNIPKNRKTKIEWGRWIPIVLILLSMILVYATGVYHYFSFHVIKEKHEILKHYVAEHSFLAPLYYVALFVGTVAISLPVADILSILGGFLFPFPWNLIYVVVAASLGACVIFLASRIAIQDVVKKKIGTYFDRIKTGFRKNGWCYLLFLRFIPLFPFWLVNIVSAFFAVTFLTFLWTTVVGILPISYIHVQIGAGLHKFLDDGNHFSIQALFNTQMRIGLILLGVVSLLPLVAKKYIERRNRRK